eukprot:5511772-Pleurochrysis_carterae.AAC.5
MASSSPFVADVLRKLSSSVNCERFWNCCGAVRNVLLGSRCKKAASLRNSTRRPSAPHTGNSRSGDRVHGVRLLPRQMQRAGRAGVSGSGQAGECTKTLPRGKSCRKRSREAMASSASYIFGYCS